MKIPHSPSARQGVESYRKEAGETNQEKKGRKEHIKANNRSGANNKTKKVHLCMTQVWCQGVLTIGLGERTLSTQWTPHQIHQGRWADTQPFGQLSRAYPSKRKRTLQKRILEGPMLEDGSNQQRNRSEQCHEKADPVGDRS